VDVAAAEGVLNGFATVTPCEAEEAGVGGRPGELATVAAGEVVVLGETGGVEGAGVVTVAESTLDVTLGAPAELVVAGTSLGVALGFGT
jgi:hypothetical protein